MKLRGRPGIFLLLTVLVPRVSRWLNWWLNPTRDRRAKVTLAGALLVSVFYAAWMFVFSRLS